MPAYTEQEIITGCRNQDRAMQEQLYKQYYSLFLKICARYAKDMEDAEQLMQDGFMRIFSAIDSFKNEGSFEGWMKRIVVNNCLDYLKSKYLKTSLKMHLNDSMVEDRLADTNSNGLEKMAFKELLAVIQTLPDMARTVFNLFVFEGYSHKQIAGTLNISEGTSSWHVHHARKLLQEKLTSMNQTNKVYARK